jgi:quercetin dioxygenase-like cupin family protein
MTQISVTTAAEQPLSEVYAAPTAIVEGRSSSRLVSPEGFTLWLVASAVDAPARLRWDTDHGDEAVYVKSGRLRVGDRTCGTGSVVVVESGAAIDVDVDEPAELVHFGPAAHTPPADGPNGAPAAGAHRAHVIGPRGYTAREEPTHATRQYANATCPTCRINLFQSWRSEKYRSAAHSHTEDELIHVLAGELTVGGGQAGPGDTLAVSARSIYGFQTGDDGYLFLNYSADASSYIPARPGPSKVLENPVPFTYSGDGDDYIARGA